MKNIFKIKRHPPRSPEIPIPSPSPSTPPPISPNSCSSEPPPPPSAAAPPQPASGDEGRDFFLSEEEFQMQLALAISASNSEFPGDPDRDQIRAATLMSLGRQASDGTREVETAESLSRQYWEYNVLDYNEKVVDGFYDIFALSTSELSQGKMPSLGDLQASIGDLGYEVIVVNRAVDTALVELEQVVQCIQLDCPVAEMALFVQRMSELVTQHMGGPAGDTNDMVARWMEKSTHLRTSLQTSLFPIGFINVGLSRHRALLFKVLADDVGIPCRLVKGSHYTGGDDDAVNIIKLDDGREFLVDLMAAPGTLIPADVLSMKDVPLNSHNSRISKTGANLPKDNLEDGLKDDSFHNVQLCASASHDNDFVDKGLTHGKTTFQHAFSDYNAPSSTVTGSSYSENTTFLQDRPMQYTSTAASTSKEKGIIEAPTVSDNMGKEKFGMGVNPQYPSDSRDLFAELNPFQVTVAGKASAQYKSNDGRNGGYQTQRENTASGPVKNQNPLIWKGHYPRNEVPNRKLNSVNEGSFLQKKFGELNPSSSQLPIPAGKNYSKVSNNVAGTSVISHPVGLGNSDSKAEVTYVNSGYSSSAGYKSSSSADERPHDELKLGQYPDSQKDSTLVSFQSPGESYAGDAFILDNRLPQEQGRRRHKENENIDGHHGNLLDTVSQKLEQQRYVKKKLDPKKSPLDRFMALEPFSETAESSTSSQIRHSNIDPMLDDVAECEILWEQLVIGERIGLGSYGEVYRADWNGTEVAVKKFLDQDFYGHALDEFRSEVRIMRRLRNPNVVLFLGAVTRPPNLSIVTEFLPRGSLYRILHRPNCQIDEKRRIKMALDVAKGMNCLHKSVPTIVHRDLKSPNLLVDNNWTVKVCDFGLSRLKHNTFLSSKSTAGTPEWMAPEVLRNEPSNEKCDIYSFGVILWELATLRMPWSGMNPMQVVGAVGFQDRRLEIPKEVDPLVARIIWECWQTDPSLRPSFDQLTIALKSLQRLVIPSHQETQSSTMSQEIPVHLTP